MSTLSASSHPTLQQVELMRTAEILGPPGRVPAGHVAGAAAAVGGAERLPAKSSIQRTDKAPAKRMVAGSQSTLAAPLSR